MTTVLHLSGLVRAMVWRELVAAARFDGTAQREGTIAVPRRSTPARYAAIEVVVPKGGRTDYGLLGACYIPGPDEEHLRVLVDYHETSTEPAAPYPSDLSVAPEQTFVGLSAEFASSVLESALVRLASGHDLGGGELRFSSAAYGMVGSNVKLFGTLGKMVVDLLSELRDDEETLRDLIERALSTNSRMV